MAASATLVSTFARAKKDPLGALVAAANRAGVRFRHAGADFKVSGMGTLSADDQAVLRAHLPAIAQHLRPPVATGESALLDRLGTTVEVVAAADRATEILTTLPADRALGFDCETAPIVPSERWLVITKAGRRAVHQPAPDKSGLDPMLARPRLVQVYDPDAETAYVFDLHAIPATALAPLTDLRLVAHNAAFEAAMLGAIGIPLRRLICTKLMAALLHGAERGGLDLATLAKRHLGLDVPKGEQVSDWSAARLSAEQLEYAAADAVIAHRLATVLWRELDQPSRATWRSVNVTLPIAAKMRLAGVPFDRDTHGEVIAQWEADYAAARDRFRELTGEDPPAQGPARTAWLEARIPELWRSWWPRTATGGLRCGAADLDRLAEIREIRPLLEVADADKRLRCFGRTLLDALRADGRIHPDIKVGATITGRASCSSPNLQQPPQDARRAVIAPPGRTFVIADFSQVEVRIAAELSGDPELRAIYETGGDLHTLNAELFAGAPLSTLTPEERSAARSKAKRITFGTLYGSGPAGLAASCWSAYRLDVSVDEAARYRDQFYQRYPVLQDWQRRTADEARATGVLRSRGGRPFRAEWRRDGIRWTICCNFPIQATAAELLNSALVNVAAALDGLDAALILQVHDELLVECDEAIAAEAAELVTAGMTSAWTEMFPDAPADGIVEADTRRCWAKYS